jgi:hypothetical protein
VDVDLHDHRVQRDVDPPTRVQQRGKDRAVPVFDSTGRLSTSRDPTWAVRGPAGAGRPGDDPVTVHTTDMPTVQPHRGDRVLRGRRGAHQRGEAQRCHGRDHHRPPGGRRPHHRGQRRRARSGGPAARHRTNRLGGPGGSGRLQDVHVQPGRRTDPDSWRFRASRADPRSSDHRRGQRAPGGGPRRAAIGRIRSSRRRTSGRRRASNT